MKRLAIILVLVSCNTENTAYESQSNREKREWNAPCHDQSTLLATTAGSPSYFTCPNKRHHMHVQVASGPSNEEFGALVFCECEREAAVVDAGGE